MSTRASLVIVSALVLAACGGGDDSSDGVSGDSWCELAQRIEDSSERYDQAFEQGGVALGEAFDEFATLLNDGKAVAPSEISEAVDTSAKGIERFGELLEEADYDLFEMDEAAFVELESMGDEMDAATEQIEAYNQRECGIAPSSDDGVLEESGAPEDDVVSTTGPATVDEPDSDGTNADTVTFTGDPNSQWCVASRELDGANDLFSDVDFTDAEAVEAAVDQMISTYEDVAPLAPPELVDDVAISLGAIKQLEAALIAADYDLLNADLSALTDDASRGSDDNIEAYNEQVCGIVSDDDGTADGGDAGGDFDPLDGTIREQAVTTMVGLGFTEAEAGCFIDNVDLTDPNLASDTNTIVAVFELCDIDLARFAELGG